MAMTSAQRRAYRHSLPFMLLCAKNSARSHDECVILRQANNGFYMIERESFLGLGPQDRWLYRVHPDGHVDNLMEPRP